MSDDRARVLARIRSALPPQAARAPMPSYPDDTALSLAGVHGQPPATAFLEQLARTGGRGFKTAAALGEWLAERGALRGYCDPALAPTLAAAFPSQIALETKLDPRRIDDYDFGVTRAAGAIAETGTIIVDDRTTSSRLGALAPWIHIAVVRAETIVRSVADAVAALGQDPNVVWCTGPSKTADVEGIIIEGVHGPGEQGALVVM